MIEWLWANKEWVFSGSGVAAFAAVIGLAAARVRKRSQIQQNTAINQPISNTQEEAQKEIRRSQLDGSNQIGTRNAANISPDDIQSTIEDAPPMQRDAVAERYLGQLVEWNAEFAHAEKRENDRVRIQLTAEKSPHAKYSYLMHVWCEVNFNDYRELAVLNSGAKVRVLGTIVKVRGSSVEIDDVRLDFHT